MSKRPHTLAIVPARGGSKRIPRKNLRELAGHPLTAWSIRHAQACASIDRCIVSTDDAEIAALAQHYGAEVHDRSAELASDTANTIDVLRAIVREQTELGTRPDFVVLLQPTCPFRQPKALDAAIRRVQQEGADMLLSVSRVKAGPDWMMKMTDQGLDFAYGNDFSALRAQDQPALFRPNGSVYVYAHDCLMRPGKFPWGERVLPLVLKSPYDLDIDEEIDFQIAAAIAHDYL